MSEEIMANAEETEDSKRVSDSNSWAFLAARAASDKLGSDIVVMELSDLLGITDSFVLITGRNDRQVRAIADEVEKRLREVAGKKPFRIEGLAEAEWILLDYVDFVVHVFNEESRQFYDLERLWADAPRLSWQEAS